MNTGTPPPASLNNLRAFEAVARLASFSAAADELFLTQSAVSRQIKSLEDELGAALFSRGTRHVEPTPDAQLLLRSVEPWLARLDAGVRQIREQRTRRRVNVHTFASSPRCGCCRASRPSSASTRTSTSASRRTMR